jgi:hypothetical protein
MAYSISVYQVAIFHTTVLAQCGTRTPLASPHKIRVVGCLEYSSIIMKFLVVALIVLAAVLSPTVEAVACGCAKCPRKSWVRFLVAHNSRVWCVL